MINEAFRWHQLGVSCVPVQPKNKHYDVKAMASKGYKLADLKEQLPTLDDLKYWFDNGSNRRLAIITGKVVCIDFDSLNQYSRFKQDHTTLSYTFTVKSPSKGYHCYYWLSDPVSQDIQITWEDVELKHSGCPIITAGNGYRIMSNGLLNKRTMLRLSNIFVLPMVCKRPMKKKNADDTSFFHGPFAYTDSPIKMIKQGLSISQYLSYLGYELKDTSEGCYVTCCPFHDDTQPSFWINDNDGHCNCYRDDCASERSMDILDLHSRMNDCDIGKSIFELKGYVGI